VDIVGSYHVNWTDGPLRQPALGKVLAEMGERKRTRMIRGLGRGGPTSAAASAISFPGQPPVARHGARGFAGRFTYELLDGDTTLRYGNTSRYARILHFGGTIVPKNAGALTIPVAPEAQGKRAKDFPGLFRLPHTNLLVLRKERRGTSKAGAFSIVGPAGRKGRWAELIVMFRLMKSVTLDPHPYGLLWDDVDMQRLYAALRRELRMTP
jgi:hypothetical protein